MYLAWFAVIPFAALIALIHRFVEKNSIWPTRTPISKDGNNDLVVPDVWGSYRSNLYFGMRTKTPRALLTGIAWNSVNDIPGYSKIRHSCELDDSINFGWTEHDGRSFGRERILDDFHHTELDIRFMKQWSVVQKSREAWHVKISLKSLKGKLRSISLIHYMGYDGESSLNLKSFETAQFSGFSGWTSECGHFVFGLLKGRKGSPVNVNVVYDQVENTRVWTVSERFSNMMRQRLQDTFHRIGNQIHSMDLSQFAKLQSTSTLSGANVLAFQSISSNDNVELEFVYFPIDAKATQKQIESDFNQHMNQFSQKAWNSAVDGFDRRLQEKFKVKDDLLSFSKYALSNLLGGISYFYGDSQVFNEQNEIVVTEPSSLFTDVPARANFPRGFYWDTGFHNLLLGKWDSLLSLEILSNWIEKIDHQGWIGREQILGDEARSKVPKEYITQNPSYSNPPAPLLALRMLTESLKDRSLSDSKSERIESKLKELYPKLVLHFKWFLQTQRAQQAVNADAKNVEPFLFRWRGRSKHHTLTSGLDDYPRGSIPSEFELHVDLLSWMAVSARILSEMQTALGIEHDSSLDFNALYEESIANLNHFHWDEERGCFSDITVDDENAPVFVKNIGYISIFPMLFGLLDVSDDRLGRIFDILEDRKLLWTDYGIRSLALNDPFYNHGDKYWTGPIWINLNYLIVSSLKQYYVGKGRLGERADRIYQGLRSNLIENMTREWKRTGYIWEQYSDRTGRGQRSRPFAGWSALIVLIISEQ